MKSGRVGLSGLAICAGAPPRLVDELDEFVELDELELELPALDVALELLELPALLLLELAPLLCDDEESDELVDERDELDDVVAELLSSSPPQAARTIAARRLSSHGRAARVKLGVCMF